MSASNSQDDLLNSENVSGAGGASVMRFLRRVLGVYLRPYWRAGILVVLGLALALAWDTVFPIGITFLIDMAIVPRDGRMLALLLGGLTLLFVIGMAGDIGSNYFTVRMGTRMVADLQLRVFRHLQFLPAGFYARAPTGDLMSRFSTDLVAVETVVSEELRNGLFSVLRLLASTVVLFALDWQLALISAILLPMTAIAPRIFVGRATGASYRRKQNDALLSGTLQENLGAHNVIRAFDLRETVIARFRQLLERVVPVAFRATMLKSMVNQASNAGQFLFQLAILAIGSYLVFSGNLSLGALVGFMSLLANVSYAASVLSTFVGQLIPAAAGLQRVEEVLDEAIPIKDAPHALEMPRFSREIVFEHVGFSYSGERRNLADVNLRLPRGRSVALVGRSGSGKSTVLNLLMRFYDPDEGCVQIDGFDLRSVTNTSLRAHMGVVFQETFLFNTSVRENIRMGRPGATDAEVEEAARRAEIHDLIANLPQGYDTPVGERGGRFSGGQRQRIAIARAILRDPEILLLDEATSALDPETEMAINGTLLRLAERMTVLSVTHRLAAVAGMDDVVVLDAGSIAEHGSPAQLCERQGIYYQLSQQQSGFRVSADGRYAEADPTRLRAIPLFSSLDEGTLQTLAGQLVAEHVDAGQVVFRQGDPGDRFYIIVRGKVGISQSGRGTQEVELRVLQDGEYFGEIALLEHTERTASVHAMLPSLFLTLQRVPFMKLIAAIPALNQAVEDAALERSLKSITRVGRRHAGTALLDNL